MYGKWSGKKKTFVLSNSLEMFSLMCCSENCRFKSTRSVSDYKLIWLGYSFSLTGCIHHWLPLPQSGLFPLQADVKATLENLGHKQILFFLCVCFIYLFIIILVVNEKKSGHSYYFNGFSLFSNFLFSSNDGLAFVFR